jgi:hypothetical protein
MDNLTTHTRRAPLLLRIRLHAFDRSQSRSLCHTPPLRRPPLPSSGSIPVSMWCGSLSTTFASDVMRDRQPALSHGLLGSALLLSFRMSSIPCQYHISRAIYRISRPISLWGPLVLSFGSPRSAWRSLASLSSAYLGLIKWGVLSAPRPSKSSIIIFPSFVFSFALLCLDCDATISALLCLPH